MKQKTRDMKYYCTNILICTAALIAAWACTKPDPTQTALPDAPITLSATSPDTKAMLTGDTFKEDGNRIQVYDFVTDGNTTTKHIDSYAGPDVTSNSPLHVEGTTWPFTDEIDGTTADVKQWIPGTHKFFGWLAKDVNMSTGNTPETFFTDGFTFDEDNHVLTIADKQMDPTVPQFDFLYSNINTTEPTNTYVPLEFKHLFCAVSFGIKNSGSNEVTINNIKVEKLYTKKSATITFPTADAVGTTDATVTYVDDTKTTYIDLSSTYLSLASNAHCNIIRNADNNAWTTTTAGTVDDTGTREFYLMWPQDVEDVYSTQEITTTTVRENQGTDRNPNWVEVTSYEYPEEWLMYLSYTEAESNEATEVRLNFPNMAWEAGKKYHFDIHFASKVKLYFTVVDWDEVENSIVFE